MSQRLCLLECIANFDEAIPDFVPGSAELPIFGYLPLLSLPFICPPEPPAPPEDDAAEPSCVSCRTVRDSISSKTLVFSSSAKGLSPGELRLDRLLCRDQGNLSVGGADASLSSPILCDRCFDLPIPPPEENTEGDAPAPHAWACRCPDERGSSPEVGLPVRGEK